MAQVSQPGGIRALGQVAVNVKDVDRALAFYRDVLGLPLLLRAGNLAFFDCGGVRVMLDLPEDERFRHPSSVLYYRVDDLQAAFERLRDLGVPVESEPHLIARMPDHDLWMAFFQDTEENFFALMSEVRPPAPG
jgi:methylmalonyl-CoA/ethylmalonyl-CoA epimerase